MSTHYLPESGKTRTEVHAFVDFLLSIRLPPALESGGNARDAAELSTAGCWRLPGTSAPTVSTVHEGSLDRHGEVLEKSPPVKDAEPAFCCNGTSLAGHSDSADKPRFSLTRVCRGQNRTSRPPF